MDLAFTDMTIDPALSLVLDVEREQAKRVEELPFNFVRLGTGVVLEITGITPETYNDIIRLNASREPKVPNVDLGKGRLEENPNDPEYKAKWDAWQSAQSWAVLLAIYAFGTQVHHVPAGVPGPDSEEWIDQYTASGLGKTNSKTERLIAWIKYCALSKDKDKSVIERSAIMRAAGRILGTVEADVQEAVKRP